MKALLISLLLMTASAQARLGETLAECKKRYGEPVSADKDKMEYAFSKNEMVVVGIFREEKCIQISFKKASLSGSSSLSEEEVQILLSANGGGQKWTRMEDQIMMEGWTTEDERQAHLVPIAGILTLTTREGREQLAKEKAASDRKKLEDF